MWLRQVSGVGGVGGNVKAVNAVPRPPPFNLCHTVKTCTSEGGPGTGGVSATNSQHNMVDFINAYGGMRRRR